MTEPEPGAGSTEGDGASAWSDRVRDAYEQHRTPLWKALLVWSGSAEVADEAVSEAFAQLLRRGDGVRDPAAWAWKVAFRVAAGDLQRRRQHADRSADLALVGDLAARPDRLPDDALDLLRALRGLSEQQRAVVALVDASGHSAASAAEVLGTTAATVRVQLMRARRRLRTQLDHPEAGAPSPRPGRSTPEPDASVDPEVTP